ncbi:TolC family protein [Sulfurimonas sp. NWX79]|uniref:TolC family protein n=1 Tax=Sulfurimonas sp. NWX79 TaxID=2925412 RepID=UPI003204BC23
MNKKLFLPLFVYASLHAMSLDETIQKALQHNNSLKKISLEVEQSKANRASKKAQNFGRINLIANYDHYNNSRTLAPLTPMDIVSGVDGAYKIPTTNDLTTAGIAYNVVLFNGFAQQNSYKISDILYKNSIIKSKLGHEELIYNVRTLYLSLLALDEQLQAQESYTASQFQLYEKIAAAYKLGSKSKLDTLKAKNSYEASRSNEDKIRSNIEILRATLTTLIGGEEFANEEPLNINIEYKEDAAPSSIENLSRYRLYALKSDLAAKKVESAYASYYPKIDFSSYYGYSMGPNATTNTSPLTNTTYINKGDFNNETIWQVGLHLKWNLYDFGSKSSQVQKEKLALMSTRLEEEDIKLEIDKNLKVARSKLTLAKSEYNAALSQYELLHEIAKVEAVKYENSAVTLTDLLDSRAKAELAYAKMINAKYEFQKAKYYIDYLLERGEKK